MYFVWLPILLFIIIFAGIIGLCIYVRWYNSPEQKGKRGEKRVHKILSMLPPGYLVLDDVILELDKGTTQIDHIVVSKYGVFVIETKNYVGEIYGDDNRQEWTQIIATNVVFRRKWYKTYTYISKNYFYNPIKQSLAHIFAIKKVLKEWSGLIVVPIVVFTGNSVLRDVQSNYHVIYDDNLLTTIFSHRTICLSDKDVTAVISRLTAKNVRSIVDNKTHVNNVYAARYKNDLKIASGICPKCGGRLVLRNGAYGDFLGCSNYPKCKFTTR